MGFVTAKVGDAERWVRGKEREVVSLRPFLLVRARLNLQSSLSRFELVWFLMLLYIVKRLGVLFLAGYRVDPLGGTLFEFGQVSFASFDFADAA